MKKLYLAVYPNGNITRASCPIVEAGAKSEMLEVEDSDYEKAMSPNFETVYKDGKLSFKEAPKVKAAKTPSLEERVTALENLNK